MLFDSSCNEEASSLPILPHLPWQISTRVEFCIQCHDMSSVLAFSISYHLMFYLSLQILFSQINLLWDVLYVTVKLVRLCPVTHFLIFSLLSCDVRLITGVMWEINKLASPFDRRDVLVN